MKNTKISALFNKVRLGVGRKSPEILIGLGVAGMVTTVVFAVKATSKALPVLEKAEQKHIEKQAKAGIDPSEVKAGIPQKEVIKLCWKFYIPTAITGAVSVACIVGANSVHSRRNAALATAYKLSETALSEYRSGVIEELGEEKEKIIRDKVSQKHLDEHPVSKSNVVITGTGEVLCFDTISGRYFMSDIETIRAAINNLNRSMTYDMYVSLSEFYDELNLEHTAVSDELGWNLDNGLIQVDFDSRISDDGRPCVTLEYLVAPRYDFSKLY